MLRVERLMWTFAALMGVVMIVLLIAAPAYSQSGDCADFQEQLDEHMGEYEDTVVANLTVESDPYDLVGASLTLRDTRQFLINMHSRGLPCEEDAAYYLLLTVVQYQDYITRILALQSIDDPEQYETIESLANSALEAALENYRAYQNE